MKITIPGPIPSKKNSKRIISVRGRPIIISSAAYLRWNTEASDELHRQGAGPFTGKISHIDIYFWWPDNRRRDISNVTESVMDLLVDCKIIPDDCWQEVPELLLKSAGVDKANPRAEVEIFLESSLTD